MFGEYAVTASDGFELVGDETVSLPLQAYTVHAPEVERRGALVLAAYSSQTEEEELVAHDVYDVSITPSWGGIRYSGSDYQVSASNPRFVLALWSDEDSGLYRTYEPSRLIDTSLRSTSAGITQLAWDTFQIDASPGVHAIDFTSGSLGTITVEIEVVE